MSSMKSAVADLRAMAAKVSSLKDLYPLLEEILKTHTDELGDFNGTYRFEVTDKNLSYGGKMQNGVYSRLGENEQAEVTLRATDSNFLDLLSGRLSVVKAMLFGKIKVQGNIKILEAFAKFL